MARFTSLLYAVTAFIASVDAAAYPRHGRHVPHHNVDHCPAPAPAPAAESAKAIYIQTNKSPNSILAIPVAANGSLSGGTLTNTGGNGGNTVDANGQPAVPDPLSSQGSVFIAGNFLFAVNAGSNSVSMFSISSEDPTELTLLGQPAITTGDFPTSVAVSAALNMVCAAHTGARAGISCTSFSATGISAFDTLRPFDLGQVNPPVGPLNGIGDTFFTADSSALVTTVKGDPTANNTGFISVIATSSNGSISQSSTNISPAGTAVLFGGTQIPGTSQLLITDASFGAVTLDLNNLNAPLTSTKIADQKATCWAKVSPVTGTGFVTDVAVNHLVNMDLTSGSIIESFNSTNGNTGMIDFVAAGSMVYALAPGDGKDVGAHVAVFDVVDGVKDVQNFALVGADVNAQGMAVLLA